MNILCIGDIIGRPGRRVLREELQRIQNRYQVEFTIANGENAAGGFGLIPEKVRELAEMNVDVITTGNHIWDRKEIFPFLDQTDRVLRPANFPPGVPGRGYTIVPSGGGTLVGVINLQGRVFMPPNDCPFRKAEELLPVIRRQTPIILVDFHAEATSEKLALGRFLDSQVSAVFGTHTHVQTADERILPGGTAYITDLGMTGPHDSVIGMEIEGSLKKFLFGMPGKYEPEKKGLRFNGLLIRVDRDTGRALEIERLNIPLGSA